MAVEDELVNRILSLYKRGTNVDQVIGEMYGPNARFADPFGSVDGQRNVQAQFRALQFALRKSSVVCKGHYYDAGAKRLAIESDIEMWPYLWLFPLQLRVLTEIQLNDDCTAVVSHVDHWSIETFLNSLPIVGFLFTYARAAFGLAISLLCRAVLPCKFKPSGQLGGEGKPAQLLLKKGR